MELPSLKSITQIIRECCNKPKIKVKHIEQIVVVCETDDAPDTVIELNRTGFKVSTCHPLDKKADTMRVDMSKVVITAEREAQ